jgi:nucleoid DNA-binding protein
MGYFPDRLFVSRRDYQGGRIGATAYNDVQEAHMANAPNKTVPTNADVADFIAKIEPAAKQEAANALLELFTKVTGHPAKIWGPSIIGFGSYHYKYDSGREGDSARSGFSPRKAKIVIYLSGGYSNADTQKKMDALRAQLGKHSAGQSCLYINKLTDIDLGILEQMIRIDKAYMDDRYPE